MQTDATNYIAEFMYVGGTHNFPRAEIMAGLAMVLAVESGELATPGSQDLWEPDGRETTLQYIELSGKFPEFANQCKLWAYKLAPAFFYCFQGLEAYDVYFIQDGTPWLLEGGPWPSREAAAKAANADPTEEGYMVVPHGSAPLPVPAKDWAPFNG